MVNSEEVGVAFNWVQRNPFLSINSGCFPANFESHPPQPPLPWVLLSEEEEGNGISGRVGMNIIQTNKENDHQRRLGLNLNSNYSSDSLNYKYGNPSPSQSPSQTPISSPSHLRTLDLDFFKNSRFLKPAQQLLDEAVCVSDVGSEGNLFFKNARFLRQITDADLWLKHSSPSTNDKDSSDRHIRITKLITLSKELERQYEKYWHSMNDVITKFELVAGTDAAKCYINLTIKAMCNHFLKLREVILVQFKKASKSSSPGRMPELSKSCNNFSSLTRARRNQNLGLIPLRQVWRPLRGLPEKSVAILRTWLFEHFLHPYPNDSEKLMLSSQTGLTRNQISNWFINARVRLWKPMIEDMYREEFADNSNN